MSSSTAFFSTGVLAACSQHAPPPLLRRHQAKTTRRRSAAHEAASRRRTPPSTSTRRAHSSGAVGKTSPRSLAPSRDLSSDTHARTHATSSASLVFSRPLSPASACPPRRPHARPPHALPTQAGRDAILAEEDYGTVYDEVRRTQAAAVLSCCPPARTALGALYRRTRSSHRHDAAAPPPPIRSTKTTTKRVVRSAWPRPTLLKTTAQVCARTGSLGPWRLPGSRFARSMPHHAPFFHPTQATTTATTMTVATFSRRRICSRAAHTPPSARGSSARADVARAWRAKRPVRGAPLTPPHPQVPPCVGSPHTAAALFLSHSAQASRQLPLHGRQELQAGSARGQDGRQRGLG